MAHPYNKWIPQDVLANAAGLKLDIPVGPVFTKYTVTPASKYIRLSLRTSDPRERKARAAQVDAYLETVWQALRRGHMVPLSHAQSVALAGELYQSWVREGESTTGADWDHQYVEGKRVSTRHGPLEPGLEPSPSPESWEAVAKHLDDPEADPERVVGAVVTHRLMKRGIAGVDENTRVMVVRAFYDALRDAVALRHRQAAGDYTPDPKANRFPAWENPIANHSGVVLTELVEDWWKEAKKAGRSVATYEAYVRVLKGFVAFLKHDDAGRVTEENVIAYKDHRLAEGKNPKTVRDGDLAALKAVFEWAKVNHKMATNPAANVKMMRITKPKLRPKSFYEEEAHGILHRATAVLGTSKLDQARHWVPWLCAYTGARVGEMAQLRKADIREDNGVHYLHVTPEAGTVKDKEFREVAIHPHLVDMGFLDFAAKSKGEYLFIGPTNDLRRAIRLVSQKLARFARITLTDMRIAPNHGWRHTFKTRGRNVGISDNVLDAMCGHAPGTEGGNYGDVPVRAQAKAMEIFPRFTESS